MSNRHKDLLIPFLKNKYFIEPSDIPEDILLQHALQRNHFCRLNKDTQTYDIFGIKYVSVDDTDMFESCVLKENGIYDYEDVDDDQITDRFNFYMENGCCGSIHSAGLWSMVFDIENTQFRPTCTLCKPILVKYALLDTIPIWHGIKGKKMTVLSKEINGKLEQFTEQKYNEFLNTYN